MWLWSPFAQRNWSQLPWYGSLARAVSSNAIETLVHTHELTHNLGIVCLSWAQCKVPLQQHIWNAIDAIFLSTKHHHIHWRIAFLFDFSRSCLSMVFFSFSIKYARLCHHIIQLIHSTGFIYLYFYAHEWYSSLQIHSKNSHSNCTLQMICIRLIVCWIQCWCFHLWVWLSVCVALWISVDLVFSSAENNNTFYAIKRLARSSHFLFQSIFIYTFPIQLFELLKSFSHCFWLLSGFIWQTLYFFSPFIQMTHTIHILSNSHG